MTPDYENLLADERQSHADTLNKLAEMIDQRDAAIILQIAGEERLLENWQSKSISDLISAGNSNVRELLERAEKAEAELHRVEELLNQAEAWMIGLEGHHP